MSSPETYIAFAAIMLVIALLAVAIDWFGKPMRHRKFVPKIYRFPDERTPKRTRQQVTPWSDAALVLPVSEGTLEPARPAAVPFEVSAYPAVSDAAMLPVMATAPPAALGAETPRTTPLYLDEAASPYPDEAASPYPDEVGLRSQEAFSPYPDEADAGIDLGVAPEHTDLEEPASSASEAGAPVNEIGEIGAVAPGAVSVFADVDTDPIPAPTPESDASEPIDAADRQPSGRANGWQPGDYVFNLTGEGREPSPSTVRTRYWKNVAATAGAAIFGASNMDRLVRGKPPQRRNPRTGKTESMHLPTVGYHDNDGEIPVPAWPTTEIDPFTQQR